MSFFDIGSGEFVQALTTGPYHSHTTYSGGMTTSSATLFSAGDSIKFQNHETGPENDGLNPMNLRCCARTLGAMAVVLKRPSWSIT